MARRKNQTAPVNFSNEETEMYCATCGSLINEELNYCNRCGNRVAKDELTKHNGAAISALKILSVSTGWVGVVGLGGLIGLIGILLSNHAVPELIVILSILFLATTFGICFLMTRQISRLVEAANPSKQNSKQKFAPEQLNSFAVSQIESPRETFVSVTENTTRTLDKTKV
jgi:preprotein translocase subunit SecG